jgi:uncharacterized protein YciI
MVSKTGRRKFLGMSLTAAGAGLVIGGVVEGAENRAAAGPPAADTVYLVIYRPGERWRQGQPLQLRDHGRYMLSLYRQGVLRFAGPFSDDSGGAAVFAAADDAAAAAVVAADPAVKEQVFAYELRRWTWVDWARLLPSPATD